MENYSPFTDQENPPVEISELIAEYDVSPDYEIDAGAIFRTINGKYIAVVISGCS